MEQGLINFFVNDTIDYIQLKEGLSMNGIISAIKGFVYKMGSTTTSSGILAIPAATECRYHGRNELAAVRYPGCLLRTCHHLPAHVPVQALLG